MKSRIVFVFLFLSFVCISLQDKVDVDKACTKIDARYAHGAAQFVAELLGKPYQPPEKYTQGSPIGTNSPFKAVPGDVVGYSYPEHDPYLAVYVGYAQCPCQFLDVPYDGGNVRCWREDGYGTALYEYSY